MLCKLYKCFDAIRMILIIQMRMTAIIHAMGHSRDEKAASHDKIVEVAAGRIRRSGTATPGVVEIMKAIHAGQIHGMYIEGETPAMSDPGIPPASAQLGSEGGKVSV